jgi:hypothetical protein
MAVNQRLLPLHTARLRRAQFPSAYFKLSEATLIAGAIAVVCILSILFLAQTGRVATAGYRLQELQQQHTTLLRESEQYEYRIATASRLDRISGRAAEIGMRPVTSEQLRYATIELPAGPVVATANP